MPTYDRPNQQGGTDTLNEYGTIVGTRGKDASKDFSATARKMKTDEFNLLWDKKMGLRPGTVGGISGVRYRTPEYLAELEKYITAPAPTPTPTPMPSPGPTPAVSPSPVKVGAMGMGMDEGSASPKLVQMLLKLYGNQLA